MSYRGESLDLRTPQTWASGEPGHAGPGDAAHATSRGRPGHGATPRGGPIWVDETVLGACNQAFDIALAHRAAEVRLVHLLNALTRLDEAADAIEARGLRVTSLRRDTAMAIASESPSSLQNGKGAPRDSEELEETLRLAASTAARRDQPAGVDDVLRAMPDVNPDLPGLQAVARSSPRYSGGYHEALPPFARGAYALEGLEASRERTRAYGAGDASRSTRAETSRVDLGGTAADSIQNSRLDALEQMVRALSNDLQGERKVFTGVLQDLQREIMAQRDEMTRFSTGLPERMPSELGDRLQSPERAVMSARPGAHADLGPVMDRLAQIERALQLLQSRPAGHVDLTPIVNRLDIIEEALLSHETQSVEQLSQRIKALEDALAAERTRAAEAHAALMALIERQKSEIAVSVLTPLVQRVETLTGAVEERDAKAGSWQGLAIARIGAIEQAVAAGASKATEIDALHAQELSKVHDALMKLNANQQSLAGSVGEWRQEGTGLLGSLATRLASIEKESAKPVEMLQALSGTVDKMHKVTVERYYRRNRFWYWLFGTDDWVAASWPSQSARIVDDLKAVKSAPKK